jgi:hypothetical protein
MFRHLKAQEVMDFIEGSALKPKRTKHIAECDKCRERISSTSQWLQDISNIENDYPDINWTDFRSSVQERLLKQPSSFETLTKLKFNPIFGWTIACTVLLLSVAIGVFWSYNTPNSSENTRSFISDIDPTLPVAPENSGSLEDYLVSSNETELLEAELVAWAEEDIFSALSELDTEETKMLLELLVSVENETLNFFEENLR